jgi:hypothetical protein
MSWAEFLVGGLFGAIMTQLAIWGRNAYRKRR